LLRRAQALERDYLGFDDALGALGLKRPFRRGEVVSRSGKRSSMS